MPEKDGSSVLYNRISRELLAQFNSRDGKARKIFVRDSSFRTSVIGADENIERTSSRPSVDGTTVPMQSFGAFRKINPPSPDNVLGSDLREHNKIHCLYYARLETSLEKLNSSTAERPMTVPKLTQARVPLPSLAIPKCIANYLDRETSGTDTEVGELGEDMVPIIKRQPLSISQAVCDHIGHRNYSAESWLEVPLRSVAANGGLFVDGDWVESKDQDPEGGIRLLQLADVGDSVFLDKSDRWVSESTFAELKCTEVLPGDLLIARMPDPIARCTLAPEHLGYPLITVVDVAILRPGPGWDNRFVMWAINSSPFRNDVDSRLSGSTRMRISRSALGRTRIPKPPLEIQQRIADYLDRETAEIDAAVADLNRYLELLQQRKSQAVEVAVTGNKKERFPLVPIQLLFRKIMSGTTPKGDRFYTEAADSIPWITTSELREKDIFSTRKSVTPTALKEVSSLAVYPPGTILIAMYGATIGRFGRTRVTATSNQACCALFEPVGIDPEFFYLSLFAHCKQLKELSSGGGQPNIKQDTIRRFRVPVPPLSKQKEIANQLSVVLHDVDELIAESTKLRDLLLTRRSVLITEVVTGRKQV